ncbi:MAG TPA: gluconate 2-dehydrogenase subunit 3 family protein [Kofleriaceae bacterium]|nr:gluconate 2-dehydrogenase subunit 3 family protein [Kofleriaceae bacterium]
MPITRRAFLTEVVWSSMGTSLVLLAGCQRKTAERAAPDDVRGYFTADEKATLAAACERILPRDHDPGAIDLGVPDYIDRALVAAVMTKWRAPLRKGLADLDSRARTRTGMAFAAAGTPAQEEILAEVQAESRRRTGFFRRLVHLTLEGAFGDPRHGGNKGGAGWRLIGFTPSPLAPQGLAQLRGRG